MILRNLSVFFLSGLCLFALKRVVAPEESEPVLVVQVSPAASEAEVTFAVDEAVLVETALAHGGALLDPVVREQLLTSMRIDASDLDETEAKLLERALSLGIHKVDPVVKQRLAYQGEQLLSGRIRAMQPTDAALSEYLGQHAARYREQRRLSFAHAFVSRARFGDRLEFETKARGSRLEADAPKPEDAFRYADPTILPLEIKRASKREIAARFGDAFANELEALKAGGWRGPIASSFGQHFVYITASEPERLPDVEEIRARLTSDLQHDLRKELIQRELRALRSRYRIEVKRSQGAGAAADVVD